MCVFACMTIRRHGRCEGFPSVQNEVLFPVGNHKDVGKKEGGEIKG